MTGGTQAFSALETAVIEALEAAVIVTDLEGRIFLWNRAAERLYGYRRAEMLGANVIELFVRPEDRDRAGDIMTEVLAGRSWSGEFPIRRQDGTTALVRITDSPLVRDGELVGVVGIAEDISDARYAEARAADREDYLRLALHAAGMGTWRWEADTGRTLWDEQLEAVFGLPPGGFDGSFEMYCALLHPDDRDQVLAEVRQAMAERRSYEVRHKVLWPDGSVHWIEGLGQVVLGPDGEPTGTMGCARDVTERVVADERLRQLHRVTEELAAAGTIDQVVGIIREHGRSVIGAATGAIALPVRGGRALQWTGQSGALEELPSAYRIVSVDAGLPVCRAARTARPVYIGDTATATGEFPDLPKLLEHTSTKAIVCLPMPSSSGGTAAVLVLGCAETREFSADERELLESIARQCEVALERAQLIGDTRRVAERLQQGLAPQDVPAVAGVEIGAFYRAGGAEAERIGGDWYDVIAQPDGSVVLVVGDVMGRGVDAATTMTRIRSAVRAFASVDPTPAVVLRKLDGFIATDAPDEFVTLVYAVLQPATGQLTVLSAGHVPPLVAGPTGVQVVDFESSPPLGLASTGRPEWSCELRPEELLMLCSDGLVERPGADLDAELRAVGERAGALLGEGMPANDVAAELAAGAARGQDDDVTVLLVRRPS